MKVKGMGTRMAEGMDRLIRAHTALIRIDIGQALVELGAKLMDEGRQGTADFTRSMKRSRNDTSGRAKKKVAS